MADGRTSQTRMWRRSETKRLRKLLYKSSSANGVRECGDCTACCTVMAVQELGKGMYRACEHVGGGGCSIYEDRPRSCRLWSCQWRLGELDGERPDRSGIIVSAGFRGGPHYQLFELWEGAASHQSAVGSLNNLRLPVYVFRFASQGRSGTELHGDRKLALDCPFGHGEPNRRISLPVLPASSAETL